MRITPVRHNSPQFVGEVRGIDLSRPLTLLQVEDIEQAIDRYGVLVFRDQDALDDATHIAFGRHFGALETNDYYTPTRRWWRRRRAANGNLIQRISNLTADGEIVARDSPLRFIRLRDFMWHTDSSFRPIPAKYSMLRARHLPLSGGGDTEFADMRAAWDELDPLDQQLTLNLVCRHSENFSKGVLGFGDLDPAAPVVPQRLVRRHPVTGRLNLYLASHAGAIDGWPVPEARVFLRDLIEHATQRRFVYPHQWRHGDMVMWDNRVTMHRARRYNQSEVRDLHRVTVSDIAPTLEQPV